MSALLVGYARCSTDAQDLTAQRDGLTKLGVAEQRIYVDHGLTGTNRGASRAARGAGRVPSRRHPGGHQAGPARPVATRRSSDRR